MLRQTAFFITTVIDIAGIPAGLTLLAYRSRIQLRFGDTVALFLIILNKLRGFVPLTTSVLALPIATVATGIPAGI